MCVCVCVLAPPPALCVSLSPPVIHGSRSPFSFSHPPHPPHPSFLSRLTLSQIWWGVWCTLVRAVHRSAQTHRGCVSPVQKPEGLRIRGSRLSWRIIKKCPVTVGRLCLRLVPHQTSSRNSVIYFISYVCCCCCFWCFLPSGCPAIWVLVLIADFHQIKWLFPHFGQIKIAILSIADK